jgi:hypothetical protein
MPDKVAARTEADGLVNAFLARGKKITVAPPEQAAKEAEKLRKDLARDHRDGHAYARHNAQSYGNTAGGTQFEARRHHLHNKDMTTNCQRLGAPKT